MRKIKNLFIMAIIMLMFLSTNVFAVQLPEKSNSSVVSISSETVGLNTDFYVILNLSNITYTKFKVEITNTSKLSATDVTSNVSELSTNQVVTSFIVDKNSISLDKLGIVYTSSKDTGTINFEVKITNLDETVDTLKEKQDALNVEITNLKTNLSSLENTLSGLEEDSDEYKTVESNIEKTNASITEKNEENEALTNQISDFKEETLTEKTSIQVVEQDSSKTNNGGILGKDQTDTENEMDKGWNEKDSMMQLEGMEKMNKEMSSSMLEMMTKMSNLESNLEDANNTISSLTQSVTYQGSQNNYLKSLSISNVEFKNEFKKTTLNYFATVDENVSSVTVNATAEDSSAIVTVYGNTNLQDGKNKIMVTVTADDGSIRTYKIYVTK